MPVRARITERDRGPRPKPFTKAGIVERPSNCRSRACINRLTFWSAPAPYASPRVIAIGSVAWPDA
jgi:hypothetical protein